MRSSRKNRVLRGALIQLLAVGSLVLATQSPASAHSWVVGNVYAAISNGQYQQYSPTGTPGDLLQPGTIGRPDGGFTTHCALNPAGFPASPQNLYSTVWSERKVVVVPDGASHPPSTVIDTTLAGTSGRPEGIAFNTAGEFFVGLVDAAAGEPNLLKYSKAHVLIGTWVLPVGTRGVDAIDLAADGSTIYYTSEDNVIRTWSISTTASPGTGVAGTFHTGAASSRFYGLRLLQASNPFGGASGTGFLMVADTADIKVLNGAGTAVLNTYGAGVTPHPTFGNGWFSVSIDAGGSQFVAGDFYSGRIVKFNANGTTASNFVANPASFRVNGVCVKGELTVGVVPFPSSGFFVVGDLSAGLPFSNPPAANNVTFIDQQWKKANDTSGGEPGHNSFKGFAENTIPVTADCGGAFESKGGHAGAPASLPVNSVVAVIVTKQVASAGGNSSGGNIDAIVLVKVTSYSGGGVPSGTGTVIQVICST